MFNWKKKVSDWENQRNLILQQQRQAQTAENINQAEKILQANIKQLGETFFCHICLSPATKPVEGFVSRGTGGGGEENGSTFDDWSQPADLWQCNGCQKWTCKNDLLEGKCKNCWSKKTGLQL